jgi:hypothetical protein
MSSKNLWADLSQVEKIPTPRTILLEQADYLTKGTSGMLVGSVGEGFYGENLRYSLNIKVPALNNYLVSILAADHGIDLYPVHLVALRPPTDFMCRDEAEFEKAVGSVLASEEVKTMLSRLLSQLK